MDPADKFSLIKEAFTSVSGIWWPIGIIVAMFLLTRLFPGFRKPEKAGALWPNKGTLSSQIDALGDLSAAVLTKAGISVDRAASDLESLSSTDPRAKAVLDEAEADPALAIIRLSALLNEEARIMGRQTMSEPTVQTHGRVRPRRRNKMEFMHPDLAEDLKRFSAIGTKVQNKRKRYGAEDARRCLNAGIELYIAMKNLNCENA